MDHSQMDHSGMDMSAHKCNMNMLFTWSTQDLCIVFRWWHISGTPTLIISLLAIVALGAAYEALRSVSRRYETFVNKRQDDLPNGPVTERTPFLWSGRNQVEVSKRAHVIKASLYAAQTFYAFMLMLLFMTYNGWVMIAVTIGAFVGYLVFGNSTSATKDGSCH
ncbi:CTR2 long splice variant [Hyaloscypha variabilis F]|uniref:Copper transport protein n=1 Tax=Hyaloscypha variabilis (strain UAMH 11265 / GT02V1 / F) TaxID=1149755 RepID=A0A2J6RMK7_HYAVF|nr:CTR2 long splice variant [Hyaloscypha variabilis F]